MSLGAVLLISFLLFSAYVWGGIRDAKHLLLFGGIVSIPFEITYSFYYWQPHNGWTSGIEISISQVFFGLLFLLVLSRRSTPFRGSKNVMWAIVLFIVASGLSIINSEVRKLTACQMILVAEVFVLYYWVFVNSLETREDIRAVLNYLCISMLLQGAFCLALYVTGLNFNRIMSTGHWNRGIMMSGTDEEGGFLRAVGSFPQPNGLAAYLVPLLLLQFAIHFGTGERSRLRLLAIVAGLFGLLASFSRGGWLSFLICLPPLMVALGRLRLPKAVLLAVVIALVGLAITPIRERMLGDDRNSAASRMPLMHLAMNIVKAHPIIGVGANTYAMAKYKYVDASLSGAWLDQVHNTYLLIFAETGMLGLGSFMFFLVFFYKETKPCVQQNSDALSRAIALGVRFGLFASMLHMCVDMFHNRALLSSMFLLCGLLTAINYNLESLQSSEEAEEFESLSGELPQVGEARQA